ncbi:hypothetical protein V5F34_11170 [Xanthobacter autotrophicus]|uniref:hypothetical protein n=1 Tax=Xanthobacter autotrophicus TaxID=280 RepID=UPI00372685B7
MALKTLSQPQSGFPAGQLLMTSRVSDLVERGRLDPAPYLSRHLRGDWGDLGDHDWQANDSALRSGEDRLFSAYEITFDLTLWIITERDRSATTLLLPEEY